MHISGDETWAGNQKDRDLDVRAKRARENQADIVRVAKKPRQDGFLNTQIDSSHLPVINLDPTIDVDQGSLLGSTTPQSAWCNDEIVAANYDTNARYVNDSMDWFMDTNSLHHAALTSPCAMSRSSRGNSVHRSPGSFFSGTVLEDHGISSSRQSTNQSPIGLATTPSLFNYYSHPSIAAQDQDDSGYICFGLVIIDLKSPPGGVNEDSSPTPVRLKALGHTLMLHSTVNNKYLGLVSSPAITKLLHNNNILLDAKLVKKLTPKSDRRACKGKANKNKGAVNQISTSTCAIEILVSGEMDEMDSVCDLLSDSGLYLQHPRSNDTNKFSSYNNPHFMVRPGGVMLGQHAISEFSDTKDGNESRQLLEVQKNQLMRVFDAATVDFQQQPEVRPSPRLVAELQEHQKVALAFMIEKESGALRTAKFPILWELSIGSEQYRHVITRTLTNTPEPERGGILADDMGLGKTLAVLALICSSIDKGSVTSAVKSKQIPRSGFANLVVTPKSTILNWQGQIQRHIKPGTLRAQIFHGNDRQPDDARFEFVDVVITTYETLRSEWAKNGSLVNRKWLRVILDEAHHIRNRSSQVFQAVCALRSSYRWCLTGTPIHNCLDDFGALLSFIGISPFVDKARFDYWIIRPLQNKQKPNLEKLRALVRATCLRRTKTSVQALCELPPRTENVAMIDLSPADRQLYNFFNERATSIVSGLNSRSSRSTDISSQNRTNILALINNLRLICNHGAYLLPASSKHEFDIHNNASNIWQVSTKDFECYNCRKTIDRVEPAGISWIDIDPKDMLCSSCNAHDDESEVENETSIQESPLPHTQLNPPTLLSTSPSAKIEALLQNLFAVDNPHTGTKSVVFSYWTRMLDSIESTLACHGFRTQRIDGSTSLQARAKAMNQFQNDPDCSVMLASIGSAGEGVDFIAANHVHLMEPHWNPMIEAQAVDRVHRIGQTRSVTITRYIVRDSIENYVQWLQQDKIKLINQSIDSSDLTQANIDEQRWEKLRTVLKSQAN